MSRQDTEPIVIVLDDDPGARAHLTSLLATVHIKSRTFASVRAFCRSRLPDVPSCLVSETRMPDGHGLDLQDKLRGAGSKLPIIFIAGNADIRMAVRAMKGGATEFLTKPFREQDLLDVVHAALEGDRERREADAKHRALVALVDKLPAGQRTAFRLIAEGWTNTEIGREMRINDGSVRTLRCVLRRKFGVRTNPDLMRTGLTLFGDAGVPTIRGRERQRAIARLVRHHKYHDGAPHREQDARNWIGRRESEHRDSAS